MTYRFLIACVVVNGKDVEIREDAIVEATSFNEAAEIAEANWPLMQISVVKIGRILNVAAESVIQLGDGCS